MKKIAVILIVLLSSCTKEVVKTPTSLLEFEMNNEKYSLKRVETAIASWGCGLRQYEITAYTESREFFKINWTDKDTLQAGLFIMGDHPTNNIVGTATFWYSGRGTSFTARKPFTIRVISYSNHNVNAIFSGGGILNGYINNLKIQEL